MTSYSNSLPIASSFSSKPNPQTFHQTLTVVKKILMPLNNPSPFTENGSLVKTKVKEQDDNTSADSSQPSQPSSIMIKPIEQGLSQIKPSDDKRISEQDDEDQQNVELISKKQRTSVAEYKEVTQAIEEPVKKASKLAKEPKIAKDPTKRSESQKEPRKKKKLDTSPSLSQPRDPAAILHDEEVKAKIKQCKKIRVGYSEASKQLNFTLDYLNQTDKTMETIELTRNQMLTYDPHLVLAFYEQNLQFPQTPEFDINKMKRL